MIAEYKATIGFDGILSMENGEVRALETEAVIVKDLARIGWIKKVEKLKKAKEEDEKEEA